MLPGNPAERASATLAGKRWLRAARHGGSMTSNRQHGRHRSVSLWAGRLPAGGCNRQQGGTE
eukprot:2148808-Alexandrium_andersonii.AAC.1